MKIGIYDPYLDTLGGGEKYMLTAASCLSRNHSVSVFWNDSGILKRATEILGLELGNILIEENIFSSKVSTPQRLLKSKKFDSIFYLSDGSIPFVLSKRLFVHFQFPIQWVRPAFSDKLKMSRISSVICNSKFTKEYVDKTLNISSKVVYPPISTGYKKLTKKNIILTVGRIQANSDGRLIKKQDILIQTFKMMVDSGVRNWEFLVVGSFLERDRKLVHFLKDLCGRYPIKILTNISADQLEKYYSEAKIYWHATGFGENVERYPERAEHFGMSTVEAMAHYCVPVVIDIGGQKEIVEDEKNGFFWDDPKELIEKTELLIKNSRILEEFSLNAAKRSEDFSYDKFCSNISDIFV